jgi:hypothetical protein
MLLRVLGPLVVLSTLGVLGSGLALVALGPDASRTVLFTALGQQVDTVTLHQALFILFAVATGLHILARAVPAVTLATGRLMRAGSTRSAVPGGGRRMAFILATLVIAVIAAVVVLGASTGWEHDRAHQPGAPPAVSGTGPGACGWTTHPIARLPVAGRQGLRSAATYDFC